MQKRFSTVGRTESRGSNASLIDRLSVSLGSVVRDYRGKLPHVIDTVVDGGG
jgi:hypothetical protein